MASLVSGGVASQNNLNYIVPKPSNSIDHIHAMSSSLAKITIKIVAWILGYPGPKCMSSHDQDFFLEECKLSSMQPNTTYPKSVKSLSQISSDLKMLLIHTKKDTGTGTVHNHLTMAVHM